MNHNLGFANSKTLSEQSLPMWPAYQKWSAGMPVEIDLNEIKIQIKSYRTFKVNSINLDNIKDVLTNCHGFWYSGWRQHIAWSFHLSWGTVFHSSHKNTISSINEKKKSWIQNLRIKAFQKREIASYSPIFSQFMFNYPLTYLLWVWFKNIHKKIQINRPWRIQWKITLKPI